MISKETKKANITVIAATIIVIIYLFTIAWSFLYINGPQDENSDIWAYTLAPLHYALILLPAVLMYAFIFAKNILKVKYLRWIVYPAGFITFFLMFFLGAFIVSPAIIWLFIFISAPVIFMLFGVEIFAITFDIYDFKNKDSEKNNTDTEKILQKIINIILCIVITPLLAFDIYYATAYSNWDSEQSSRKCADFYKGLQLLSNNVDAKLYNDFESLTDAYKKELEKDAYKNILGNYDKVECDTGQYESHVVDNKHDEISTVKWMRFYLYDSNKLVSDFNFKMDEYCSKHKDSCNWRLFNTYSSCSFYQDKNGKITPTKRTKNFIKYNNK